MKKKSKHARYKRKNEFRFHAIKQVGHKKIKRHPTYIFLEKGNLFIYVIITHSSKVNNYIMIKLRKNPDPKDKSDSYYVAEIKADTKDTFSANKAKWTIDPNDEKEIREMFEKTKKDDSADQEQS